MHYVAPRLFGSTVDWACEGTNKWVFRLIAAGALIILVPGVILGALHGSALQAGGLEAGALARKR